MLNYSTNGVKGAYIIFKISLTFTLVLNAKKVSFPSACDIDVLF